MADETLHPETLAVTAGRPPHEPDQPLNAPITMASTYVAGGELEYGRYGNPTWSAFEDALGALEGGRCLAFASGLAAVATVLDLVALGEKVVVPRHAYQGSLGQLDDLEMRGRVTPVRVDIEDTDAVVKACEDASLVWVESPTNPALEVADLPAIIAAAHDAGCVRRGRQHVRDAGAAATARARRRPGRALGHQVHRRALRRGAGCAGHPATTSCTPCSRAGATCSAPCPGPSRPGWRCAASGRCRCGSSAPRPTPPSWRAGCGERPEISAVRYPGFGAILAIELARGAMAADLLTHTTRLWVHATSLGGVESTFERRRRWRTEAPTIDESLVRMSVGIEHVDDLWDDLVQALEQLPEG